MREMISIADIKRLPDFPAQSDHGNQIEQRHRQHEQWVEHGKFPRMRRGVKVWKNSQDRQQITHQVTARVAEKRRGPGKIVGQKTEERAERQESEERNEVLA